MSSPPDQQLLQLITYNTHMFGKVAPMVESEFDLYYQDDSRLSVFEDPLTVYLSADVIALQEFWDPNYAKQVAKAVDSSFMTYIGDDLQTEGVVLEDVIGHINNPDLYDYNAVGCGLMLLARKGTVKSVDNFRRVEFSPLKVPAVSADWQDAFAQKGFISAEVTMQRGDYKFGVVATHMITNLGTYTSTGNACFAALQAEVKRLQAKGLPVFLMGDLNITAESQNPDGSWSPSSNYTAYVRKYLLGPDGANLQDTWRSLYPDVAEYPGLTMDDINNTLTPMLKDEDEIANDPSQKRIDYVFYVDKPNGPQTLTPVSAVVATGNWRPQYVDPVNNMSRDLSDHFALGVSFSVDWPS